MSGHRRWSESEGARLVRDEALLAQQHMMAYVQGYIQALEDVMKDIDELSPDTAIWDKVVKSWGEALETRDRLKRM
jgi:hypothetical protein